jgi:hypothetical protein
MTQNSLSNGPSLGLRRLRFRTTSCWRRARFSSRMSRRLRKSRRSEPENSPSAEIMLGVVAHFACGRQRCILLKSLMNRIKARERRKKWAEKVGSRIQAPEPAARNWPTWSTFRSKKSARKSRVVRSNCGRYLAPRARFELATLRLTAECSTIELPGIISILC